MCHVKCRRLYNVLGKMSHLEHGPGEVTAERVVKRTNDACDRSGLLTLIVVNVDADNHQVLVGGDSSPELKQEKKLSLRPEIGPGSPE